MPSPLRGILIGGTSHVGKSTLAERLAMRLKWEALSTDKLGRHPGRPWMAIPAPVIEFYERLTPETIHWFLKVHHENMWRQIRPMIDMERGAGRRFVLEGAALRPEYIAPLIGDETAGVILHADDGFLLARMRSEAGYDGRTPAERRIIDAFIDRSLRENAALAAAARELGVRMVDAADERAMVGLFGELVDRATG